MHAGHAVHVFDKSRGPGGRLATRRLEWVDGGGTARTTRLDHGALDITARSSAFEAFVDEAMQAGWLVEWAPTLAEGSLPLDDEGRRHLPVPDLPSLCRQLLAGIDATWSFAVDRLHQGSEGWQVEMDGHRHETVFDAVVLALPPAQAAPLLGPHRADWARDAAVVTMEPCWTLMGVTDDIDTSPSWDLGRPVAGPLASVLRNDARPGRQPVAGEAHWVAHARAEWSIRHLEQPADWVRQQMQAALAAWLGRPLAWRHGAVHRWRYATAPSPSTAPSCWWDADRGLGVCGDFLGAAGVEGAWLSGQLLAGRLHA